MQITAFFVFVSFGILSSIKHWKDVNNPEVFDLDKIAERFLKQIFFGIMPPQIRRDTEMDNDQDLEKFTKKLQDQILKKIKKKYTSRVIDHWQNPRNFEKMENPDGFAQVRGSCGDTMEMFLKMEEDVVNHCTFQTDGCGTTIACGSVATELALNKSFTQAVAGVTAKNILRCLDGLPKDDVHCAQLASETLRRALADYLYKKRSPWKKHYRKI